MAIEVTREAIDAMRDAAERSHPKEACGILLGNGARIERFVETANIHDTPATHFEIDPQALIEAHRAAREGGPSVMGYFHSHPAGMAEPSVIDRDRAAHDERIWAILAGRDLRLWRDGSERFHALPYEVT